MRHDLRLRWTLCIVGVLCAFIALMLPKIWIISPPDFDQEFRVSGLDFLQSASLRGSAERLQRDRHTRQAGQAWLSALANHPLDGRNLNGFLSWLADYEDVDKQWLLRGWRYASLLLKIDGTNQPNVDLVSRVFDRFEMHDWIILHLDDFVPQLDNASLRRLVHSYFEMRRYREVAEVWDRVEDLETRLQQDGALALYHAAWRAGWGPAGGSRSGFEDFRRLGMAQTKGELAVLAMRLELAILATRYDAEGYARLLQKLIDRHEDRVRDHVWYWILLEGTGRKDVALQRIAEHVRPPESERETEMLVLAMHQLGLTEEGLAILLGQLGKYPYSPRLLPLVGRFMVFLERWEDLRGFAPRLRTNPILRDTLEGYAYYLEGVSDHGRGIRTRAEQNFARMLESPPFESLLALEASLRLQKLGYPTQAVQLLTTLEESFGERVGFWKKMAHVAYEAKQEDLVLLACRRAWEMDPRNLTLANNYAAALILNRKDPGEAIALTLDLIAKVPDSRVTRVNHALALVQNGRPDEAWSLLQSVAVDSLTGPEQALWFLGAFEVLSRKGEKEPALELAQRIHLGHLFPSQIQWLNEQRQRLQPVPIDVSEDEPENALKVDRT